MPVVATMKDVREWLQKKDARELLRDAELKKRITDGVLQPYRNVARMHCMILFFAICWILGMWLLAIDTYKHAAPNGALRRRYGA